MSLLDCEGTNHLLETRLRLNLLFFLLIYLLFDIMSQFLIGHCLVFVLIIGVLYLFHGFLISCLNDVQESSLSIIGFHWSRRAVRDALVVYDLLFDTSWLLVNWWNLFIDWFGFLLPIFDLSSILLQRDHIDSSKSFLLRHKNGFLLWSNFIAACDGLAVIIMMQL